MKNSNPDFQPILFSGGLYDFDTKLYRFGSRDYDPTVGRWTTKDPIGFAGGDTNLYAYVGGNPMSYVDPSGLWSAQLGFGGSLSFLFGGGAAESGFAISYSGESGFQFGTYQSRTAKVGTGVAGGLGISISISPNARSLNDLRGGSIGGGIDSVVSLSLFNSKTPDNRSIQNLTVSFGEGTGLFPYAGFQDTSVQRWCPNE